MPEITPERVRDALGIISGRIGFHTTQTLEFALWADRDYALCDGATDFLLKLIAEDVVYAALTGQKEVPTHYESTHNSGQADLDRLVKALERGRFRTDLEYEQVRGLSTAELLERYSIDPDNHSG